MSRHTLGRLDRVSEITDDMFAAINAADDGARGIITGGIVSGATLRALVTAVTALDARLDALESRANGGEVVGEAGERVTE